MTKISKKKWYEDPSREDFCDLYVNVHMLNGATIYGPLLADLTMIAVDLGGDDIRVLDRKDVNSSWELATGVASVDKVWSKRDWKRIDVRDVKENDAIVANGRLFHIKEGGPNMLFVKEPETAIPPSIVSQALRCIPMPKKQGFYESESEDVFYLTNDNEWWMIDDDDVAHLSLPPANFLPLTPIHFEHGEADHE